jgi:Holliday junction resolvase
MNYTREQTLVTHILAYLKINGHYVWRQNTGAMTTKQGNFVRFGYKGISDIIGLTKEGKFIAIECKIKKNKPTQFQEDFLNEVSSRGGLACVAYSIEDVIDLLEI